MSTHSSTFRQPSSAQMKQDYLSIKAKVKELKSQSLGFLIRSKQERHLDYSYQAILHRGCLPLVIQEDIRKMLQSSTRATVAAFWTMRRINGFALHDQVASLSVVQRAHKKVASYFSTIKQQQVRATAIKKLEARLASLNPDGPRQELSPPADYATDAEDVAVGSAMLLKDLAEAIDFTVVANPLLLVNNLDAVVQRRAQRTTPASKK